MKKNVGDKVIANDQYGEELPEGAKGVIIGFWSVGNYQNPRVDFSEILGQDFKNYYMLWSEIE